MQVAIEIGFGKVKRLGGICRSQRDADAFKGGLIALGGDTANGNQNICLRVVCGCTPARDLVWHDCKARGLADFPLKVTIDVHNLTGVQIPRLHIERVQEEGAATVKHTPVPVIQSVDCGVELVVAANGGQQKFVRLKVMPGDRANGELGLA